MGERSRNAGSPCRWPENCWRMTNDCGNKTDGCSWFRHVKHTSLDQQEQSTVTDNGRQTDETNVRDGLDINERVEEKKIIVIIIMSTPTRHRPRVWWPWVKRLKKSRNCLDGCVSGCTCCRLDVTVIALCSRRPGEYVHENNDSRTNVCRKTWAASHSAVDARWPYHSESTGCNQTLIQINKTLSRPNCYPCLPFCGMSPRMRKSSTAHQFARVPLQFRTDVASPVRQRARGPRPASVWIISHRSSVIMRMGFFYLPDNGFCRIEKRSYTFAHISQ